MAKPAAQKKTQQNWSVIDKNALSLDNGMGVRSHLIKDSLTGAVFEYRISGLRDPKTGRGCEMPPNHALQFLKHDSFEVYDDAGNRMEPIVAAPATANGQMKLARHQVVATYYELSRVALMNRVKQMRGGDNLLRANSPNDKLIEFLMTGGAVADTRRVEAPAPENDGLDVNPDELSDDELVEDLGDGAPANLLTVGGRLGTELGGDLG